MALDLTLIPISGVSNPYSHTLLSLNSGELFFDKLLEYSNNNGATLESPFNSYISKDGYGPISVDRYGEVLKTLTANQLRDFWFKNLVETGDIKNCGHLTTAAFAYIERILEDTKVALFWH